MKEFGLGHIVGINFQVLTGYMVDVPRQANQIMWIALGKFVTSTGRFKADTISFFQHTKSIVYSKDKCI